MNLNFTYFLALIIAGFTFSACSEKYPGFEHTEKGVYYQVHIKGNDTLTPLETDWVTILMDYRLKDTVLFKSSWLKKPLHFQIIKPMFKGDLYDGLQLMGKGDSMTFVIVADSFFYKTAMVEQLPPGVKPGSLMYYDVKLLEHISNDEYLAEIEKEKEALRQKEMDQLALYISNNGITELPLESGLYYIPLNKSKARVADTGEMCQIYMKVQTLDGKVLFDNFGKQPMDIELGKEFDTQGLMQGLSMLPLGGKVQLIVPSPIGVGETGREGVEPFTTILYEVQLLQIRTVEAVKQEREARKKAEEEEKQQLKEAEQGKIDKYVQENSITGLPLPSGLYIISIKEGAGPMVKPGNKVTINYTLSLLDGFELENTYKTNKPIEFQVGSMQVFKGWEEAILKMKKGGKAKLIMPSNMAYGSSGMGENIKPYSPLVCELEILEVK